MKKEILFHITFEDDSIYEGGTSYLDTKWTDIPNKKIKKILYHLPNSDILYLSGYDKYFHMVEAVQDLNGKERGKTKIEYAYIMGQKNNKVRSYRITLMDKLFDRHKLGDITVREFDIKDTKISKLNKKGWKG